MRFPEGTVRLSRVAFFCSDIDRPDQNAGNQSNSGKLMEEELSESGNVSGVSESMQDVQKMSSLGQPEDILVVLQIRRQQFTFLRHFRRFRLFD